MKVVNLTPHTLNVCNAEGDPLAEFPPSGKTARIDVQYRQTGRLNLDETDVPVFEAEYGDIEGLPAPEEGVVFVVSGMVKAQTDREDVFSPGELIRDEDGNPKGCKGLKG